VQTATILQIIVILAIALFIVNVLWRLWKQIKPIIIYEYQAGLLYTHGKYVRTLPAGRYWKLTSATNIVVEDMRGRSLIVAGQEMLTKDNLTIKASVVISYRIKDARLAYEQYSDHYSELYTVTQIALRKAISAKTLEEILAEHATLDGDIKNTLVEHAEKFGIELSNVMLRDLMLTADTKRAYADLFKARKEGEAALERARGETAALRSLANGARTLKNNPALFNLRLLQLISDPTAKGATIVLNTSGEPVAAPVQTDET